MEFVSRAALSVALIACLAGACGGTDDPVDAGPRVDAGTPLDAGDAGAPLPIDYEGTFPAAEGVIAAVLTVAGLERDVELYVPSGVVASPPLLIALHGTYGNGLDMVGPDRPNGFEDVADSRGVILAAPSARQLVAGDWDQHGDGETDRSYWETLPRDDPSRGADPARNPDLLLIRAIIEEAARAYGIDRRRVYVAGHSNGAFFALHVAVTLRGQIAAFAESEGGLVLCDDTSDCGFTGAGTTCEELATEVGACTCTGSEKPVPLPTSGRMPPGFLSHSNDDGTVSVAYTCALAARMAELGHVALVSIADSAGGHVIVDGFAADAWAFFETRTLP